MSHGAQRVIDRRCFTRPGLNQVLITLLGLPERTPDGLPVLEHPRKHTISSHAVLAVREWPQCNAQTRPRSVFPTLPEMRNT